MAALTATKKALLPIGDKVLATFGFTIANANAADEWIQCAGLSWIEAVVGVVPIGTADLIDVPAFVLNAEGTGVTAGTDPGALGIEGNAADWQVTVIGKR